MDEIQGAQGKYRERYLNRANDILPQGNEEVRRLRKSSMKNFFTFFIIPIVLMLTVALPTAFAQVTISALSATCSYVDITWDRPEEGSFGYTVRRADSSGNFSHISGVGASSNSPLTYRDTSISPSTDYSYRVDAHRPGPSNNVSLIGNPRNVRTPSNCLAAPTINTATCDASGGVTVSWSPVSGANNYHLVIQNISNSVNSVSHVGSATSYTRTNIAAAGDILHVTVGAISDNQSSPPSTARQITCDAVNPATADPTTPTTTNQTSTSTGGAPLPPVGGSNPGGVDTGHTPGGSTTSRPTIETVSLTNPLGNITTLDGFLRAILSILLVIAVPIIVFFIILAGFLYVTARGNTEQIGRAHRALLYALVGGLLILGANMLIDIIAGTVEPFRNN